MAKGPQPGDPAPDFELPGTDGPFRLSDHRGERVVLLFYPGDETPVCTKQFCSYRDRADDMASSTRGRRDLLPEPRVARAVPRPPRAQRPAARRRDKQVAKSYGVTVPALGTRRARRDRRGRRGRYRHVHTLGVDFQDVDGLREALDRSRAELAGSD